MARDEYFQWLKEQADFIEFGDDYDRLLSKLYAMDYTPVLRMDQNRLADAMTMRERICATYGFKRPAYSCSFLEFLVALSFRMHYICDAPNEYRVKEFFWRLLYNLQINEFSNHIWNEECERRVEDAVNRVNTHTFEADGAGGLFPMAAPKQNQRNLEVWYQLNQYLQDPNGQDLVRM